jgi:hypothetical protein
LVIKTLKNREIGGRPWVKYFKGFRRDIETIANNLWEKGPKVATGGAPVPLPPLPNHLIQALIY